MHATIATVNAFPRSRSWVKCARITGLQRVAVSVAMDNVPRTAVRPPQISRRPRFVPLSRFKGSDPDEGGDLFAREGTPFRERGQFAIQGGDRRIEPEAMAKHLHELFVFVVEPLVPPDNNRAERSLRHLVTSRKISGGTRSAAGSAAKMTLATLFGTWRLRGENPYTACRALFVSPQI